MSRETCKSSRERRNQPIIVNVCPLESETTCASIIVETIKYILYQKQQIPYTYKCLKSFAEKGKCFIDSNSRQNSPGKEFPRETDCVRNAPKIMHQYRRIVESFENLENIFKNVSEELDNCSLTNVREVMILLGSTPMSPKEMYRIVLPNTSEPNNSSKNSTKINLLHTFRAMMTSTDLQDLMSSSLKETNMYLFLKRKSGLKSSWLIPKLQYKVPTMGKQVIFFLKTSHFEGIESKKEEVYVYKEDHDSVSCDNSCLDVSPQNESDQSFSEGSSTTQYSVLDDESSEETHWYQARTFFKGFMTTIKV